MTTPPAERLREQIDDALSGVLSTSGGPLFYEAKARFLDQVLALVDAERPAIRRACGCKTPDPVMQADGRFYCYVCSFETGVRPTCLEPEDMLRRAVAERPAEKELESRGKRDSIPRYTIQQQPASIYFQLVEDKQGAWVSFANYNAIVTKLEQRIERLADTPAGTGKA